MNNTLKIEDVCFSYKNHIVLNDVSFQCENGIVALLGNNGAEQRMEFRSYLSEISKNSITLISTHIIEDVELYSDKIVILKDKAIKFQGTVEEIIYACRPFIFTKEIKISELPKLKEIVTIIEEKRINSDIIKVKFTKNENEIEGYYKEKEISLENAYIYFQKI